MDTLFVIILSIVTLVIDLIAPAGTEQPTPGAYDTVVNSAVQQIQDDLNMIVHVTPTPTESVSVILPLDPTFLPEQPAEIEPLPVIPTATVSEVLQADPRVLFGAPQITDVFERGSTGFGINAGINDDDGIRIIALNNRISLEPKKNNGWLSWRLRPPAVRDGAAEMEFSILTCARGDRTGLVMHAPDYTGGHGYYFSLACEGTISILRDATVLGTADAGSLFRNNSGDSNTLTAVIQGDSLTAALNGQIVLTVRDNAYSEGYSGFFTSPQNQDTLTMDIMTFNGYARQ